MSGVIIAGSILLAEFAIVAAPLFAKAVLFFGLAFYILTTFIFMVNIHFVHIWGIEFLLNRVVMSVFSYFYPMDKAFVLSALHIIDMKEWKYTKLMSVFLCLITVAIHLLLGNF